MFGCHKLDTSGQSDQKWDVVNKHHIGNDSHISVKLHEIHMHRNIVRNNLLRRLPNCFLSQFCEIRTTKNSVSITQNVEGIGQSSRSLLLTRYCMSHSD